MWLLGLISILLLIGLPILAIVAFLRTSKLIDQQSRFEKLVTARIRAIEDQLAELAGSGVAPATVITEKNPGESVSEEPADSATIADVAQENDPDDAPPDDEPDEEAVAETPVSQEEPDELPAAARSTPWPVRQKPETRPFDVESLVGGRWSVLLGGLALALGVVFLVKYSIEEGLLGPGPRTVLGGLFSALLLGAGEWLRRSDRDFDLPVYAKADVPGILTGAGVIGAFATLYAAHALYGFIGPAFAFIALSVVGIAALLLSSIHGPKLAAVGVLGAYATPLLVASNEPNPIALAIHVLIVTAVVMAIAHIRSWSWLAIAGIAASCAWIILSAIGGGVLSGAAGIILMTGIALIFASLSYLREPDDIADRQTDWISVFAFGALTFSFFGQLIINTELPATASAILLSIIIAGLAGYRTSTAPIALCASIISLLAIASASLDLEIVDGIVQTSDYSRGLVPPDIAAYITNAFIIALPSSAFVLWGTRRTFFDAPVSSAWLASAVGVIAFFGLVIAYLRIAPFETRPAIGAVALGIAALFSVATEYFIRLAPENKQHPVPAAFAVSGIASACFAISVSLDTGWMPLAFGLTAFGITTVYRARPVSTLPWLALAAAVICGFTLFVNMPFELPDVSGTLLFNGLIVLLGIPALALIAGGEFLRRAGTEPPSVTHIGLTAGGLAVAGLFTGMEITHVVNGGDLSNSEQSLAETAGHALAAMGFAMGLQRLAQRSEVQIYDKASQVAGILSVVIAGVGLLAVYNPAIEGAAVGTGTIFNLLLPGYLLTAVAAAVVALMARPVRPRWYTLMYAALSGLLFFTYFSLMLRKAFQGQHLDLLRPTGDLEFWLYSPLWLVMGAILLAIGLKLKSLPIRIASGLLIALTIIKVFLMDMSALTGILRAFSFIGLGLSLIVIGRFYQRILTRQAKAEQIAEERPDNDDHNT